MQTRFVTCCRGTRLVGSFHIQLSKVRYERLDSEIGDQDFVQEAKSLLIRNEVATPPLAKITFVVRKPYIPNEPYK